MPDVRLVQLSEFPYQTEESVDWLLLDNGTLDNTESLATAVIVALGTDRLAEREDILPDPDSTDRRGWLADRLPAVAAQARQDRRSRRLPGRDRGARRALHPRSIAAFPRPQDRVPD